MDHFKKFASFIERNRLREFASVKLQHLYELNAPLLQHFKDLTQEEALARLEASSKELLVSISEGTLSELISHNMKNWEEGLIKGISPSAISFMDIIVINSAERCAFTSLIPAYTRSAQSAADIANELEKYYNRLYSKAAVTMQHIQEAEAQKLHESEERYKDIFDNASDLIHIVEPGGTIMYVNKAWVETLGFSEDELKGEMVYDFVAERERDRFKAYRERIVAGLPAIETLITSLKTKDGHEVIVEGFLSCKFKDGKPVYTRGILRNITQRKAAEEKIQFYTEQLMEREENFRQLIRNAPDAIIVIDTESKIRLWNPKAEAIFGWTAMDVVGSLITQTIVPPIYREAHLWGMERYLSSGEKRVMNRTVELTAQNKAGKEFYVSLTISETKQGGERLFIAFVRDITELKENELELERKKEDLERSNKELEQFAWLASHDMKEPLRKIQTFSDLVIRKYKTMTPDMQQYMEKIHHAAERMNLLIEDILAYSNANYDRESFVKSDLNAILKEVLVDLEVTIKSRKARIEADSLPFAEVLPFQIRQLFQNLISNAIKYSKADIAPFIEIRCQPFEDELIKIEVRDNGIGFDEEYAAKIFQIFQRLVPKDEYEGTGIGLALCKKIIENHKGTITVTSEEDIGSVFTLLLPLKHPHEIESGKIRQVIGKKI